MHVTRAYKNQEHKFYSPWDEPFTWLRSTALGNWSIQH